MNVENRTIFCNDNLEVLRGLNNKSVDLIYLDPPFNSNKNYAAPIGSEAAGAAFKDTWTLDDVDNAWHGEIADRDPPLYQAIHAAELTHGKSMKSYLIMMAVRLLEMRRVLRTTGSIYLHCDPTASHYLKIVMDSIFGVKQFRNEIVWCYKGPSNTKYKFPSKHDILLYYGERKSVFNKDDIRIPYAESSVARSKYKGKPTDGMQFSAIKLHASGGKVPEDWWSDIHAMKHYSKKEGTGYPTQKPIALLDRIIKASSNKGDVVLDPFCGCATTCVAAERLQRQWIGIDISKRAIDLVDLRLEAELGFFGEVIPRYDIPKRTNIDKPQEEVKLPDYRTHKHTLYGKQEGKCNGCQTLFPFRNMTVDHIKPQSKGGTDHEYNLQLLCGACNSTKGRGTQEQLIERLKKQKVI